MEQLTQKLKDGKMQILEVPVPALQIGHLLVKNHYSLISAGTEESTVKAARKGYLGKAKERPQQVKQVLDTLKTQGIAQTYRAVMKKLDAYSPLGYSCAGQIIAAQDSAGGFVSGDFVACGGLTASHAEVVAVPMNLCVKLPADSDLKMAAYNTLGAIALQGVRQADMRLGETCAVIGMGLLGQITGLLLRASSVRVVGIDIDPSAIAVAKDYSADLCLLRSENGIEERILEFTNGLGCDAVIITAASPSLDPINFSGSISRKKGTIVVVGAVPTGFDREPNFYKKELQIKMSCSYGPGRYDTNYEEKGIDYPPAYVRWTEKRNMEAFQHLIYTKKIDVAPLTTHIFPIVDAPAAYEMILAKKEPYMGILIEYDHLKKIEGKNANIRLQLQQKSLPEHLSIGFIGAGSYAQSHLLPNIPKDSHILLKNVVTTTGATARSVGDRFGFEFCSSDAGDIFGNSGINTIFVASRHDSHARYVLEGLRKDKNIFVEKPLCLREDELEEIADVYTSIANPPLLMVGYNRRFAPLAQTMKQKIGTGPMSIQYRVNAGAIPADSWIQDQEVGGGRVIGEVCHFIDFITFLNGSLPISAYAASMRSASNLNDTLVITISFKNGSIGTISYFANGDKSLPKERIETYAHGATWVLDDFRSLSMYSGGKRKDKKGMSQDKGQKNEVALFVDTILAGKNEIIPFREIYSTSKATFAILKSIITRSMVTLV